jgi:hypothetical protein
MGPMRYEIKVSGGQALINLFGRPAEEMKPAIAEGLYAEAHGILRESRKQVPFRYGALSSSGRVHDPFTANKTTAVEITYGGVAGGKSTGDFVGYAVVQHENMKFRHAEGRKAKYLYDPAMEAVDGFAARMRIRIQAVLKRRGAYDGWWQEADYGDS